MYEVSDSGAAFPPDAENEAGSYRPRGTYAGYRAFGSGDGAVLLAPRVARELRSAAESATRGTAPGRRPADVERARRGGHRRGRLAGGVR